MQNLLYTRCRVVGGGEAHKPLHLEIAKAGRRASRLCFSALVLKKKTRVWVGVAVGLSAMSIR